VQSEVLNYFQNLNIKGGRIKELKHNEIVLIKGRLYKLTYTGVYDVSKKDNRGKRPALKLLREKELLKLLTDERFKKEDSF